MDDNLGQPSSQEMQDSDIAELEADMVAVEDEQSEPQEQESDDLPDTASEQEGEQPEPIEVGETEIDRLKRLDLYQPGLIESFDDVIKSYKHARTFISQTRPQQPDMGVQTQQAEATAMHQKLLNDIASGDPAQQASAIYEISQIGQLEGKAEMAALRREMFYSSNDDAAGYKSQIEANQTKYPGMTASDAFDMVKGQNADTFMSDAASKATQTEKARNLAKQAASREKPGGVRTTPVSMDQGLVSAVRGKTGQEAIDAMTKQLDAAGLGYKE